MADTLDLTIVDVLRLTAQQILGLAVPVTLGQVVAKGEVDGIASTTVPVLAIVVLLPSPTFAGLL